MKLIVGLGNPGGKYADSRHNVGFSVVKVLARFYKVPLKKDISTFSLSGKGKINSQNIIIAAPFTFMNLSGIALKALLKKYKIDLDNLLVVCDDLDLEPGRLKIKASGSSGGHRGLQSIIDSLKSDGFGRLRVGIGRPDGKNMDVAEYVLSSFTKKEKEQYREIIIKARHCCEVWVSGGISK